MTDYEAADSLMTTKPTHWIKPVLLYLACASDPNEVHGTVVNSQTTHGVEQATQGTKM